MKKVLKFILEKLLKIIETIIMFPLYCSSPDKYNGTSYDEWLNK